MKTSTQPGPRHRVLPAFTRPVALIVTLVATTISPISAAETVTELLQRTHVHGLAVDRSDHSRLFVATHHGLYVATPDGAVAPVSDLRDDFMGFSPHPVDPTVLYASGHPARGGNLGVIASNDGGRSWSKLSDGVDGPVDFHQMTVSAADPHVMYGVFRGLQHSADGGHTWRRVGPAPEGIIVLAASALDPHTLYAGTEQGLAVSRDGGERWEAAPPRGAPVTALIATANGGLLAYQIGAGLLQVSETSFPAWRLAGPEVPEDAILHLAVNPDEPPRLFAATWKGRLLASEDGGASWRRFGAAPE